MTKKLFCLVITFITNISMAETCWITPHMHWSNLHIESWSVTVTTSSLEECFNRAVAQAMLHPSGPNEVDKIEQYIYRWTYNDGYFSDSNGVVSALSAQLCPVPRAGDCYVDDPHLAP